MFYNVNVTTDDAAFDLTASITKESVNTINVRICTRLVNLTMSTGFQGIQLFNQDLHCSIENVDEHFGFTVSNTMLKSTPK